MVLRRNKRISSAGNTFITSLIFLFVLIGTLRLCYTKTLHEAKLTSIFVQETQGFYLLENLMALARDYAYQIVQNPREPHLFLGVNSYNKKDKLNETSAYVIDFNGSLSKQQIVPDDFSLQIADTTADTCGWEIKAGPIFWKDNRKDENDERYLSEVFILGSLKLVSKFIPDWTMRTVQTMEIERNPLCDFQLYAEGDITLNTNINTNDWAINIERPVQINGNVRFNNSNGDASNKIIFSNKFNCAGYALNKDGKALTAYRLPEKYHMYDNHENGQITNGTGTETYYFNTYATNYDNTFTSKLSAWHNDFTSSSYDSYERYMFATYHGNYNTRSRIYRPMGFDPSNYWGFWAPSETSPSVGGDISKNEHVLNYCFGFHNLAQSSAFYSHGLYSNISGDYSPQEAMEKLRGLNAHQMTEKARLVEMQKSINFPGIQISIFTDDTNKDNSSLYVPNNFIYSTYIYNAFPASKDDIFLNRYLNLAFQDKSIIDEEKLCLSFNAISTTSYALSNDASPAEFTSDKGMYMDICNNKSALCYVSSSPQLLDTSSILKLKSTFSPTGYSDDSCPPHKIVPKEDTHWVLDGQETRLTGEHYNFLYDRNRAKWIQIVDIDVSALTEALKDNYVKPIVSVKTYWQGLDAFNTNKNYRIGSNDIRLNYATNRESFFSNYNNGSYTYPNDASHPPVIDIGVRLINATKLPAAGMTFYCPYPLYIKGNFNTESPKPALIITDSLTLLHENWQDWRSQMDPIFSYLWSNNSNTVHPHIDGTTIYADIITGRTHPHFWIKNADTTAFDDITVTNSEGGTSKAKQNLKPNPDMGIHDAFRALCDFNTRIEFHGSLMLPYFCQEQWEPPIDFCKAGRINPINYAYPNLDMHPRANTKIPAGMPFYYRINRGRKTHCIGNDAYTALAGETLYGKDWTSEKATFSSYHEALPNYLKYENTPGAATESQPQAEET